MVQKALGECKVMCSGILAYREKNKDKKMRVCLPRDTSRGRRCHVIR